MRSFPYLLRRLSLGTLARPVRPEAERRHVNRLSQSTARMLHDSQEIEQPASLEEHLGILVLHAADQLERRQRNTAVRSCPSHLVLSQLCLLLARRIRHLIQDLTQRREISVALDIHRSLLLNNTTKFFGSIERDATLLQSCLLHRYFTIIRSKRFHALLTSGRANDQVPISDLTDILGMDSDDETKDYLDQLEYPITDTDPVCFIIPSANNISQQQSTSRLSQKLIKSKYAGNLKDIITGQTNAPVVIPDTTIENSFDVHGGFVGKLPFDLDVYAPAPPRRPLPTPQEPPVRPQQPLPAKRPPSESARRSMAATTTENTFVSSAALHDSTAPLNAACF